MTTSEWVHRLNALARQMAEVEDSTYPTAWAEQTQDLRDEYRRVAQTPTHDPPGRISAKVKTK